MLSNLLKGPLFLKKQISFSVFLTFVKEFIKIPTLNKNNYLIFFCYCEKHVFNVMDSVHV